MTDAICAMNNCRRAAPADEAFCAKHRDSEARAGDFAFVRAIGECAAANGSILLSAETGREMVAVIDRLANTRGAA